MLGTRAKGPVYVVVCPTRCTAALNTAVRLARSATRRLRAHHQAAAINAPVPNNVYLRTITLPALAKVRAPTSLTPPRWFLRRTADAVSSSAAPPVDPTASPAVGTVLRVATSAKSRRRVVRVQRAAQWPDSLPTRPIFSCAPLVSVCDIRYDSRCRRMDRFWPLLGHVRRRQPDAYLHQSNSFQWRRFVQREFDPGVQHAGM